MQFAEIAVICASDSFVGNRMTAIVLAKAGTSVSGFQQQSV